MIKALVFEELPNCSSVDEIKNLKKLKGADNAYRIRVGDYRIGLFIDDETITFTRVPTERRFIDIFLSPIAQHKIFSTANHAAPTGGRLGAGFGCKGVGDG